MKNMKDSPSIPQRVLVEQESNSDVLISTPAWLALAKKAGRNDVPLSVLEQVYARGIVTAEPHPKNTPEQQAFHRVDSFIHEGKAYELDSDLTEVIKVPNGSKHMGIIKAAIKHHEERNKPEPEHIEEGYFGLAGKVVGALARGAGKGAYAVGHKAATGYWTQKGAAKAKRKQGGSDDDYEARREKAARRSQASREGSIIGKYRADTSAAAQGSELEKARTHKQKTERTPKEYKPKPKRPPYEPGAWLKKHPAPKGIEKDPAYAHTQEYRDYKRRKKPGS